MKRPTAPHLATTRMTAATAAARSIIVAEGRIVVSGVCTLTFLDRRIREMLLASNAPLSDHSVLIISTDVDEVRLLSSRALSLTVVPLVITDYYAALLNRLSAIIKLRL
uniref:Uncharacterized protein n=1 Tax=Plectus sambesii TaxID=2011161 RepID=A0A914VYE6_9BILA